MPKFERFLALLLPLEGAKGETKLRYSKQF